MHGAWRAVERLFLLLGRRCLFPDRMVPGVGAEPQGSMWGRCQPTHAGRVHVAALEWARAFPQGAGKILPSQSLFLNSAALRVC